MKVLLTGAAGQLGQALQASVPQGIELIALTRQGFGPSMRVEEPETSTGLIGVLTI